MLWSMITHTQKNNPVYCSMHFFISHYFIRSRLVMSYWRWVEVLGLKAAAALLQEYRKLQEVFARDSVRSLWRDWKFVNNKSLTCQAWAHKSHKLDLRHQDVHSPSLMPEISREHAGIHMHSDACMILIHSFWLTVTCPTAERELCCPPAAACKDQLLGFKKCMENMWDRFPYIRHADSRIRMTWGGFRRCKCRRGRRQKSQEKQRSWRRNVVKKIRRYV